MIIGAVAIVSLLGSGSRSATAASSGTVAAVTNGESPATATAARGGLAPSDLGTVHWIRPPVGYMQFWRVVPIA